MAAKDANVALGPKFRVQTPSVLISISMSTLYYFKKSEVNTNCKVCNERINAYLSYGALVCASCRVFFRRHAHRESLKSCIISSRNNGTQCDIKLFKRTFCNYCRLQKCLLVGMDPEKIKKRKLLPDNQTKKKTLKLAIDVLFIPNALKTRPFPCVTSLRNLHSSMSFTIEELLFCQKFQKTEFCAWKSIPFPSLYFEKIFYKNQSLSLKGFEEMKQNSFERLIQFSNDLELLRALPLEDQFILQTINVKFLHFIRLADFFQPLYSRNQQVNLIINGCPNHEENSKESSNFNLRIMVSQIMPWIDHQDQLYQMISLINDLQLDHLSLLLVTIVLLFNVPNQGLTSNMEGITRVQDCLRLTLYRYLKYNHEMEAQQKMNQIDQVLNALINLNSL